MKKSIIALLLLGILLAGCNSFNRKDAGLVGGGIVGGVAGSELIGGPVATIGGAVGGAYLGERLM